MDGSYSMQTGHDKRFKHFSFKARKEEHIWDTSAWWKDNIKMDNSMNRIQNSVEYWEHVNTAVIYRFYWNWRFIYQLSDFKLFQGTSSPYDMADLFSNCLDQL